jgi:UDP-glucose 4-epimerase
MTAESTDLMAREFPTVELRGALTGRETLLAIDKARALLGYSPAVSWRDAVAGST